MIARVRWMLAVAVPVLLLAGRATAASREEPSEFPSRRGSLTLAGEMVKTRTFLKIRVYAVGLYVSDEALRGILLPHSGRAPTPALYHDLITRDFEKTIVLRLLRDVSAERIRSALGKHLEGADPTRVADLLSYFGAVDSGTEVALGWGRGGALEVTIGGVRRPPIEDRALSEAVFGIWLGEKGSARRSREDLVANLTSTGAATSGAPGSDARPAASRAVND